MAGDCLSAVVDVVDVVMVAEAEMLECVTGGVGVVLTVVLVVGRTTGGGAVVGVETSVGEVVLPAASGVSAPL